MPEFHMAQLQNVLKGAGNVNPEKVKRVMDAVKELGYTPQVAARNLKNSGMDAIEIILPNVTDSFYAQLYSSIESTLSAAGYSVMLSITNDIAEKEKQSIFYGRKFETSGHYSCNVSAGEYSVF